MFGGQVGGGKSSTLLMAALQFVHVPGYAALLLRRTFPDLTQPGALIPRSFSWLKHTEAQWSAQRHTWTFPSGATVGFGYLDNDNDVYQYQSSEFQFVGFDELTQFTEFQYTYMFSRLRKPDGMPVPLRMRSGTNPGGVGHKWVRDRFIREGKVAGRVFIPSALADNPHIDQAAYRTSLSQLDHITRKQLEEGNWDISAGGKLFKREWFEVVEQAPSDCIWCRFWDMAASKKIGGNDPDWTAGVLVGLSPRGQYFIKDVRRTQNTPMHTEALVKQTAMLDGREVMVRMEQEGGSSGPTVIDHYARNVLRGFDFLGKHPDTNKIARARIVSAAAEHGNVKLVAGPWNVEWLDELELFPTKDVHDDQVDGTSGAVDALANRGKELLLS